MTLNKTLPRIKITSAAEIITTHKAVVNGPERCSKRLQRRVGRLLAKATAGEEVPDIYFSRRDSKRLYGHLATSALCHHDMHIQAAATQMLNERTIPGYKEVSDLVLKTTEIVMRAEGVPSGGKELIASRLVAMGIEFNGLEDAAAWRQTAEALDSGGVLPQGLQDRLDVRSTRLHDGDGDITGAMPIPV